MAFESVKEKGVSWNPCTTGRKKEGTLKQLKLRVRNHSLLDTL
jgi:hypothetical protein